MKILLISHGFPPSDEAEAMQAGRFADFLASAGHQLFVLTQFTNQKSSHGLSSTGIRVVQAEGKRMGALKRKMFITGSLRNMDAGWFEPALEAGRRILEQEQIDLLYSRSCPYVGHCVALQLKRMSGLPWVAHFSDPMAGNPFHDYRWWIQRWWESQLEERFVQNADIITVTNQAMLEWFSKRYPKVQSIQKATVIPHGYLPGSCTIQKNLSSAHAPRVLLHAGTFYGSRSPEVLLRGLAKLNEKNPELRLCWKLLLAGRSERPLEKMILDLGLMDHVEILGSLSREELRAYFLKADAFVVIDAFFVDKNLFLPSKLIDSFPYGKPILAHTPRNSPTAQLMQSLKIASLNETHNESLASELKRWFDIQEQSQWQVSEHFRSCITKYAIVEVGKRLDDLLRNFQKSTAS